MRRYMLSLAALLLVALIAARLPFVAHPTPADGPVYTVAGILGAASRNPAAWDGKVVWVRGGVEPGLIVVRLAAGTPAAQPGSASNVYVPLSDAAYGQTLLWVNYGGRYNRFTALLHGLPIMGGLIPGSRSVKANQVTTYRVRLHAGNPPCLQSGCVVGTLLDYAIPPRDPTGAAPNLLRYAAQ